MTSEAQVLIGYGDIINGANVKQGINVFEIEKQLVSGGLVSKTTDTTDKFNDEIRNLANQFGINFNDINSSGSSGGSGSNSGGSSSTSSNMARPPPSAPVMQPQSRPAETYYEPEDHTNDYDDSSSSTSSVFARKSPNTELYQKTQEQERRSHINSVVGGYPGEENNDFSFENEKKEDEKCIMLEEIESLMYSLQTEDVDLSRTPTVDENSSYEEIERVLKILRHKIDRTRYCNLAEEFILWGAYGMEELFDGKRLWLGRYQPCLVGWHTQVQCKLRRMRYDTSQIMSSVMHDFNIGPGLRVLLELIPNMFIYSREKKQQQPGRICSDDEIAAATDRIRDM